MPAYGEKKGKASSSKSKDVFDFEADSDISKREVAVNVAGKFWKYGDVLDNKIS